MRGMATMRRWLSLARGHRGNVLVMVTLTMGGLLAFTGVAVDVGRVITTKTQLQNAFDAGSLAGASNLGFDDSALPVAGTAAVNWSSKNPYTGGAPTLTAWSTVTNASATANVQMGIWSNGSWVPSVDGTRVNAVHCQWGTNVPTPFLSLIGLSSIKISATATALSGPAANPDTPIMPLAVCPKGAFGTSEGCGTLQIIDVVTVPTQSWIHLPDTHNGVPGLGDSVALTNGCSTDPTNKSKCTPTKLSAGDSVPYEQGTKTAVIKTISDDFKNQFSQPKTYKVTDSTGHVQYNNGPGWQFTVAIICPQGSGVINTFARFVMVEMIRMTGPPVHGCQSGLPSNPAITDPVLRKTVADLCVSPTKDYIIGFLDCQPINSIITDIPGGRLSLGTKVRLVR
jgi:Flp pilus assembly protein TadG